MKKIILFLLFPLLSFSQEKTIESFFKEYNYAEVYDMNGKFILSSSNYEINISHFKEGFYIIKFFGNLDELICIKKVIKSNKK